MLGEECSDIRAGAEERRMPERYDAAVTEDQVERDGEQRKDRDFVEQRRVARCDEPHRQRAEPYGDLPRTHPRAGGGRLCRSRHQRAPARPASREPTANVDKKIRLTSIPRPAATRGSSTAARRRLPKRVCKSVNCSAIVRTPQTAMMNSRYAPMPMPPTSKRDLRKA